MRDSRSRFPHRAWPRCDLSHGERDRAVAWRLTALTSRSASWRGRCTACTRTTARHSGTPSSVWLRPLPTVPTGRFPRASCGHLAGARHRWRCALPIGHPHVGARAYGGAHPIGRRSGHGAEVASQVAAGPGAGGVGGRRVGRPAGGCPWAPRVGAGNGGHARLVPGGPSHDPAPPGGGGGTHARHRPP